MKKLLTNSDTAGNSRLGQFAARWGGCLIAPAVAASLLFLLYAVFDLFPFSRQIFAWGDMTQQSIPLLVDLKNILSGQFDLFLNTTNAGGMSFWGVFLFFWSSPFSFLVGFVPTEGIYLFSNILVLIKIACCAFTASLFFRARFRRLTLPQITALSIMYAFGGYTMFYYQNMVWLDMMAIFPMLLLGLSRLTEKGKIGLYVVALSLTVAINCYLSYMVILFLIFGMAVYAAWGAKIGTCRRTISRFALGSVIAALITAVCWLPFFAQYTHSARTTDVLTNLATSSFFTSIPTTFPVILCTAVTMAVIPMFFWSKLYRCRKALATFVVYIMTLVPVVIEPINKMWHTGSYQAFPVRYGYITVMLGLLLTAMFLTAENNEQRLQKQPVQTPVPMIVILGALTASLGVVMTLLLTEKLEALSFYVRKLWMSGESFLYFLIFAVLAVLVYVTLFMVYHYQVASRRVCSIILCCVVACESFFCSSVFIGGSARSAWTYDNALTLAYQTDPKDLFRTKMERKYFDVNLIGAMGYNTLAHYTSLTDESYMFAMKKLGYSSYWMEVGSNGGTAVTDLLLANKYHITKNTETLVPTEDKILESLIYCIVEDPDVRSFATTFQTKDIASLERLPELTRMETQQYLSDLFFDCGDVITAYRPVNYTNTKIKRSGEKQRVSRIDDSDVSYISYRANVKGKQTLYFDCFDNISARLKEDVNDAFDVYVNGVRLETGYPTQKNNGLLCLGTFEDELVTIELRVRKSITAKSFGVYGIDEDAVRKASAKKPVSDLIRSGNTIHGTVTGTSKHDYLLLPISWDSGYTAEVNGKEAEIYRVLDAFMAVKIDKGKNTITFRYVPRGFKTGLILSLVGVAAFAFALWALRCKWIEKLRFANTYVLVLFYLVAAVVFLLIYVMPIAAWLVF